MLDSLKRSSSHWRLMNWIGRNELRMLESNWGNQVGFLLMFQKFKPVTSVSAPCACSSVSPRRAVKCTDCISRRPSKYWSARWKRTPFETTGWKVTKIPMTSNLFAPGSWAAHVNTASSSFWKELVGSNSFSTIIHENNLGFHLLPTCTETPSSHICTKPPSFLAGLWFRAHSLRLLRASWCPLLGLRYRSEEAQQWDALSCGRVFDLGGQWCWEVSCRCWALKSWWHVSKILAPRLRCEKFISVRMKDWYQNYHWLSC